MITSRSKHVLNQWLEPFAAVIARTGVSPTVLTLATPLLTSGLSLWFVLTRHVLAFCAVILLIGCLDGLDGAVARVSGQVTKFGAYLDAMCDRYVEAIVVLAVASVTGTWALSMVVLAGGVLVSYAKARAAMEVPVSNLEWPDLMERTERSIGFLAGLALSRLCPWRPMGHDLFWWTLVVLSVAIHATVVQRVFRARRLIAGRSGG